MHERLNFSARFPVVVHANYCNGKSHELSVRGLWLLGDNYTDVDSDQCRPLDLETSFYNVFDWSTEVEQILHKYKYMYDSFVTNGSLIQATNGIEVFVVDVERRKRAIPDRDTFVGLFGESFHLIRRIPDEVLDLVPAGATLPSLRMQTPTTGKNQTE